MIILHNSYSEASRAFVAAHGGGAEVYDWYKGGREAWTTLRGTMKVSAFPSVVVDMPAYRTWSFIDGDGTEVPAEDRPAEQRMIRQPRDMADVQDSVNKLNALLSGSFELTLENLNETPTGRINRDAR